SVCTHCIVLLPALLYSCFYFLFLLLPHPPRSPLFPYTTLFRSSISIPGRRVLSSHAQTPSNAGSSASVRICLCGAPGKRSAGWADRKSTRLNSSHQIISYAVFCLKKKKKTTAY